ncbi:MAG TPA: xanthine dehydrogenase molybdopterin binding subunit [Chiayiivirga sp.]|nr:xanthine dehydrogenase molybdopterin binding subunit [Chiayiivirga sp.]
MNRNQTAASPLPHESAAGHVTGRALYADEQLPPQGLLSLWPVVSPHAHARILRIDARDAAALPGVEAVLTSADIPGENDSGAILHDEPVIAADTVSFHGQSVAWVLAKDDATARAAAARVRVEYEPLPAILGIEAALAANAFHLPPAQIARGDAPAALAEAPVLLEGALRIGGQEHFYLETQASWACADGEGGVQVTSSTQHPSETQAIVARVLGLPASRVVCRSPRMGGGFGGKETQANPYAAVAALAAWRTGRPVRIKLERGLDMRMTGKRHPFLARWRVGCERDGTLRAMDVELFADGGWSCDLSPAVLSRAMVHVDNACFCPNVRVVGRICRTHLPSNTAFRGFGGPQGVLVAEEILEQIARHLGLPAHEVHARNFYREGQTTHYGQPVRDNHMARLWRQALEESDLLARRARIAEFNAGSRHRKRGLAITPIKFGISFNKTEYNQAGALLHAYTDGSLQLHHGGTEMGQGLHTKMLAVAARTLGVHVSRLRIMPTATDKVPNTSATAASTGADLNGPAVKAACETLLARLRPVAAALLEAAPDEIEFADDRALVRTDPARATGFTALLQAAYARRVSLSATGFYATPGLSWDPATSQGHPFHYFAFGAAACEVEVDGDTGVHRLLRVDVLHDVGDSLHPAIDRGQIEGGFVQGLGWLTCEELRFSDQGRLLTDAPSTYKIPTLGEVPVDFRVQLYAPPTPPRTASVFGSKAVGEPPLMLAIAAREAIREAVAAFGRDPRRVELAAPATPEAIFRAIESVRGG